MARFMWTCLAAAITLAGCGSLSDRPRKQSRIDIAGAAELVPRDRAGPFSSADVPSDWWRLYRDPTLDALVRDAMAANTDLRVASANLYRFRAALDLANSARVPSTSLSATPGFARSSAEEELKGRVPLPSVWVYGAAAAVSYQVDLFGQIAKTIDAAKNDLAAAQAAHESVQVTVIAEVTRAYVESCALLREELTTLRLVEIQARRVSLTTKLVNSGRAINLDALRVAALEDRLRSGLPGLAAKRQLALYRIAALTGRVPSALPSAVAECPREPLISGVLPVGDGIGLLRRRPDIRQAERNLAAANARVGAAVADLYPKIVFGASVGSAGLIRNAFDAGTNKFSLGPLISWEFPNRRSAEARILERDSEEAAAAARLDGVMLNALRETESALVAYSRGIDAKRALEAAGRKARRAAEEVERLYAAGRQDVTALLTAESSSIEVEQALAAADTQLAANQVALFLALGGGWHAESGGP